MRLEEIAAKELVLVDLRSNVRTDAVRELVELVSRQMGYSPLKREEYLAEVLKRHDRAPSGLAHGLAFPNARISDLPQPTLAIGLSKQGLNFEARDGRPTHVVFLYLDRSNPPEVERRMLSRLSETLTDPKTADAFRATSTIDDVWNAIPTIDSNEPVGAH